MPVTQRPSTNSVTPKGIYQQHARMFRVCVHCGRSRDTHRFELGHLRCIEAAVILPKGARRPSGINQEMFDSAKGKRLPDGWTITKGPGTINPWQLFDDTGKPQRYAGRTRLLAMIFALSQIGTPIACN